MERIYGRELKKISDITIAIYIFFSVLGIFEFVPELGTDNTETALQRLRYLIVSLPVMAYAIVIGLMWRYPINRERQREMRTIIEERERVAMRSSVDP